jgi:hypothetical protein
VQKTLPHALSRAAAAGAVEVGPGRLANVLKTYAVVQDKIGSARCVRLGWGGWEEEEARS